MEYSNYERIQEKDFWRLTVCKECGALLYRYETKEGKTFCVSVLEGMTFHRYGNNNNYVTKHECGSDTRHGNHKKYYVNVLEVSEEVKEKVTGTLQQQAVMKVLTEFSKKNVRSSFKKSMFSQAQKFLNGETEYKNPFSPKQVFCLISDMITTEPQTINKKHVELNLKKHVLSIVSESSSLIYRIDDINKTNSCILKEEGKKEKLFRGTYWNDRAELIENIYESEYSFSQDETTNYYTINA